jgi:hypothetical protein
MAQIDDLVATVQALSMKKHFGMDVEGEVNAVIDMCKTEADKKTIVTLCRALGVGGYDR